MGSVKNKGKRKKSECSDVDEFETVLVEEWERIKGKRSLTPDKQAGNVSSYQGQRTRKVELTLLVSKYFF